MKFYFDRTQSPHLARAVGEILQHLNHEFDHSRGRYPGSDPGDVAWMRELAAEGGWIIISGDVRITRNPAEKATWQASGLTSFFLQDAWMKASADEQAWRMMRWLSRVVEIAGEERPGTGLSLPLRWHQGRLVRLYSPPSRRS